MKIAACLFIVSFSVATAIQAQAPSPPFTPLSGISGLTPPQEATGLGVETLCPQLAPTTTGATGDLQIRCTELIGNALARNTGAVPNPLQQMAAEEVATQGTSSVETSNVQFTNIGARLAALRAGARGISLQGLAVSLDGKTLPGPLLASLFPSRQGGGTASTDEPLLLPKLPTLPNGTLPLSTMLAGLSPQSQSRSARGVEASVFERLGFFVTGTLSLGEKDATRRESGFDFDTHGITGGVDYRFTENLVLGAAFGYSSTDADLAASSGNLDFKAYSFSIFGTYYVHNAYVDGIVNVGWNDYETNRNIVYSITSTDRVGNILPSTTNVSQTAKSSTDGTQYALSFGAGYDFNLGGFTFGPYARLNYLKSDIDGFRERIANTAPGFGLVLQIDSQDVESLASVLGGQGSYAISTQLGVLVPQVRLEWEHEFQDDSRIVTARFVSDPTRTPIRLRTDDPDRNFFNLGFGLSAVLLHGVSAFVYYETVLGLEDVTAHKIAVGARLAF